MPEEQHRLHAASEPAQRPDRPSGMDGPEKRLRSLVDLTRHLSSSLELKELMELVVREVLHVLDMDRGALLLDRGAGRLETVAACSATNEPDFTAEDQAQTEQVVAELKRSRRPVITLNLRRQKPDSEGTSSFFGRGSVVGVPLLHGDKFIGAICLDSESKRVDFAEENDAFVEAVAAVAALSLSNARARTRMVEAARLSADFGSILDIRLVLDRALSRIVDLTHAEQGFLMLRDEESKELHVVAGIDRNGRPLAEMRERFLSRTIVEKVGRTGEPVLSDDLSAESEYEQEEEASVVRYGLTSILCVPIRTKKAILGVVYLENRLQEGVFDIEEMRLVQLVADRAGMAIENARLYGQEREVVRALANAVEARDLGTSSHVQRVSQYAVFVGRRLGLSDEDLMELEQCAMLHDVGKIGIPDRVLLKPGELNASEWQMMRAHPELGLGIVNTVRLPKTVKAGVLYHQEAYDGSGYPHGLKGEQIPLFSRIIGVVDAYDAIVTDRPYRKARSQQDAIAELDRCAGTKFDPEVVLAFLEVLYEETDVKMIQSEKGVSTR